jgi:hypothetical protein
LDLLTLHKKWALKVNMKKLILVLTLSNSVNLFSEGLCPDLDVKVDLDQWMTESSFSEESALLALEQLAAIVTDDIELDSSYLKDMARINALQVLEGHFLKVEALNEQEGSLLYVGAIQRYCEYLENAAWVD